MTSVSGGHIILIDPLENFERVHIVVTTQHDSYVIDTITIGTVCLSRSHAYHYQWPKPLDVTTRLTENLLALWASLKCFETSCGLKVMDAMIESDLRHCATIMAYVRLMAKCNCYSVANVRTRSLKLNYRE